MITIGGNFILTQAVAEKFKKKHVSKQSQKLSNLAKKPEYCSKARQRREEKKT